MTDVDPPSPWPYDARPGSFLSSPPQTPGARRLYDEDVEDMGFVMNTTRLWAHLPDQLAALFDLMGQAKSAAALSVRERGILVTAAASTTGDSYCSLAWGEKLAGVAGAPLAASVLTGDDDRLSEGERALAGWARHVAGDPNATTESDLDGLRAAGYDDTQILAITVFVSLRLAFSTVNDALGARPDSELIGRLPAVIRDAVTWGRTAEG